MREVNKNMLTKKYNNGFVTLDAKKFLSVAQEAIDREVRNFEPVKTAVEKLYELECKNIPATIRIYCLAISIVLNADNV